MMASEQENVFPLVGQKPDQVTARGEGGGGNGGGGREERQRRAEKREREEQSVRVSPIASPAHKTAALSARADDNGWVKVVRGGRQQRDEEKADHGDVRKVLNFAHVGEGEVLKTGKRGESARVNSGEKRVPRPQGVWQLAETKVKGIRGGGKGNAGERAGENGRKESKKTNRPGAPGAARKTVTAEAPQEIQEVWENEEMTEEEEEEYEREREESRVTFVIHLKDTSPQVRDALGTLCLQVLQGAAEAKDWSRSVGKWDMPYKKGMTQLLTFMVRSKEQRDEILGRAREGRFVLEIEGQKQDVTYFTRAHEEEEGIERRVGWVRIRGASNLNIPRERRYIFTRIVRESRERGIEIEEIHSAGRTMALVSAKAPKENWSEAGATLEVYKAKKREEGAGEQRVATVTWERSEEEEERRIKEIEKRREEQEKIRKEEEEKKKEHEREETEKREEENFRIKRENWLRQQEFFLHREKLRERRNSDRLTRKLLERIRKENIEEKAVEKELQEEAQLIGLRSLKRLQDEECFKDWVSRKKEELKKREEEDKSMDWEGEEEREEEPHTEEEGKSEQEGDRSQREALGEGETEESMVEGQEEKEGRGAIQSQGVQENAKKP